MDKDALIASLQKTIESQALMLEKLSHQVEQLLRQLYGKKSEKSVLKKDESNHQSHAKRHSSNHSTPQNNPKRSRLPEELERVDVIHDINDKDKICKACHSPLHRMGERISERLDFVPAKLIVKRHICYKWGCRCNGGGVLTANMPSQAIEKGIPGSGLLAEVLVSKYQDALPLYRQMLRFKRLGYTLADSTMGDWVRECALLFKPIVDVMREDLLLSKKIHTDDTPVPVLAKGKTRQGRLWVYLADHTTPHAMCLYDYTPTRHASGPARWLADYQGYLQADAYNGYDSLYTEKNMIEVGCFAHMRRKFYDVAVAAKGPSHAQDIVDLIAQVYSVERQIKNKTTIERFYYRKKHAKPKLKKLKRKINDCFQQCHHRFTILQSIAICQQALDSLMSLSC